MISQVKGSIAHRLIILVVAFSSLITLITTGLQLFNEYEDDVGQISSRISQVFTSSLLGISETVWVSDEEQLKIMLSGIVELPDIIYVEVVVEGKSYLAQGEKNKKNTLQQKENLNYFYRGVQREIGTLIVVGSLDGAYQRLIDRVWIILISNAVKTFLLAIFIYFLFLKMVTSRLKNLVSFASGVRVQQFKGNIKLPEIPISAEQDELDVVSSAFNLMQAELQASFVELTHYRERLEDLVNERTAELATSNQELEAFCYSVSHDLRSPLRSINGFASFLEEEYAGKLGENGIGYLSRIQKSANKMDSLIDALLSLSRISRGEIKVESVNLSQLAQTSFEQLYLSWDEIHIQFKCKTNILVKGDKKMLAVVLDNLLGNACKYSQHSKNPSVEVGCIKNKNCMVYFVKDNGVGFDIQFENKIYEPFHRLHGSEYEGAGIGLATVQRIVRRHHGRIWAESEMGNGSTFYFTLFENTENPISSEIE